MSELVQINNFQYKAKFNLIAYFFENSKGLPITIRQTGRDCNTVHFRPKCQQKPSGFFRAKRPGNKRGELPCKAADGFQSFPSMPPGKLSSFVLIWKRGVPPTGGFDCQAVFLEFSAKLQASLVALIINPRWNCWDTKRVAPSPL